MSRNYVKKPIETQVDFATNSGKLNTLEGIVKFKKGDALVTGVKGERWPIDRNKFKMSYKPITPLKFGTPGKYLKNRLPVSAIQTEIEQEIQINQTKLHAKKGDWIITSLEGNKWVVDCEIFQDTYLPLD